MPSLHSKVTGQLLAAGGQRKVKLQSGSHLGRRSGQRTLWVASERTDSTARETVRGVIALCR